MGSQFRVIRHTVCKATKTTKIDYININDTIINDKQKISEALNDYFVSIGEKLANEIQPSKNTPEYCLKQSVMIQILNFETFDRIKLLNC